MVTLEECRVGSLARDWAVLRGMHADLLNCCMMCYVVDAGL